MKGIHWSCSGFSAHSPVCRYKLIALVLCALMAHAANGSPATTARMRKNVSATDASHRLKKRTHPSSQHARRPAKAHAVRHKAATVRAVKRNASLRRTRGLMPAPLRGSSDSLARQNDRIEAEGLERIEDDQDLHARIQNGFLVPLPVSAKLAVSESLPVDRRYCRPWTAVFLTDLARAHAAMFHKPLEVSSAVRTVEYQKRLMVTNGNAAPAEGDIVSPHVTGATIDLAKQGMSRQQLGWLRRWLLGLEQAGKIDVEEEFRQACFHITVYKSYLPAPPLRRSVEPGPEARPEPPVGGIAACGR